MTDAITCPKCRTLIEITELLKAPLIAGARKQFERELTLKTAEYEKRELRLKKSQLALENERLAIRADAAQTIERERRSLAKTERKRAQLAFADDLKQRDSLLQELQRTLTAKNAKLAEAQSAHADVIRKGRELDDARREINLSIQNKVQESLHAVRETTKAEVESAMTAIISKKETQLAGMQRQIEELRRKSEQGSQQLQGEALERELETMLRERFHEDRVERVLKGEPGGDLLQHVFSHRQLCGHILWEAKRTKVWSDKWFAKLRRDQRSTKADFAIIVSDNLPKGIETFDYVDNIWVAKLRFAIPLSIALRQSLIELTNSRRAAEGQRTKSEVIYQYLTGPRFRHRIEAIVERFTDMQIDLDRERKAMTQAWARREQQLLGVLDASTGLYGDIQGIAGRIMPEIESLSFRDAEDAPSKRKKLTKGTGLKALPPGD